MTNELPKELIESALALCGKKFEQFEEYHYSGTIWAIERFLIFLLSPEFIEKYTRISHKDFIHTSQDIGFFIHEYQSGNSTPLIELLNKICPTDQNEAH